ncbi:MICOS complex subunit MIC27 isoform 2-T2 [Clarias gariepinus]|uniref:MICOS complex subunit MIC27 n=1 Tax=Clarias gariepinus TaxID=13013 RepID=UPI00234D4DB0|nr:MICOS complex subunit MIC27 [Clarias gariepinus]
MVAKVVKLAAVPAALGLASLRVYATTEKKTDGQISPRDLCIYSAEAPALRYVEEKPGRLQTNIGLMRAGLQSYTRAVQNTFTSVNQAGQDTYNFLRDPPPGFLPRVGVITLSGLAGLVLARKGSRLKRIAVPLALTAVGAAVCYPTRSVRVLKVTGKKVYGAGSLVASALRSKPKEKGVVLDASPEDASNKVVPQPDELPEKVPSLPGGESGSSSTIGAVAPFKGVALATKVTTLPHIATEESGPVSEDSPAVNVASAGEPGATPGVGEFPSPEMTRPEAVMEVSLSKSPPADMPSEVVENVPESAAPLTKASHLVKDETTTRPLAVKETKPHTRVVEEALPPPANDVTCPPVNEKTRFVPDPALQDHGQAHPDDADLYSTRG